jgi:acyl-CoA thioesterase-1
VVLASVGVTTTVLARAGAGPDRCGARAERAAQRAELVTGAGPEVLVVGDSYSVGVGVGGGYSWPVRLPGRVRVDGFSGSGFSVGASACGDVSYANRAERSLRRTTDLVVVEGGLNDHDQPVADVEAGAERLLDELGATPVLLVGPPVVPDRPRAAVEQVDAALARVAAERDVSYLSMLEADLSLLDDRLHPDRAGHRAFGDRVADEVARLLADLG